MSTGLWDFLVGAVIGGYAVHRVYVGAVRKARDFVRGGKRG